MWSSQQLLPCIAAAALLLEGALADASPKLDYDPNTEQGCTWWVDYTATEACSQLLSDQWVTEVDFRRWNPSVGADCAGMVVGHSYCVEALNEGKVTTTPKSTPTPTSSSAFRSTSTPPAVISSLVTSVLSSKSSTTSKSVSSTSASTTTPKVTPSPTVPANGIATPTPFQPNMVNNCNKFHYVVKDVDYCSSIASKYNIPLSLFLTWNPAAGDNCGGLWADAYACVSVIGYTAPVAVPTPHQPNIIASCKKYDFVDSTKGDTCSSILSRNGISLSDFVKWNPDVGSGCTLMWADAYVCVNA